MQDSVSFAHEQLILVNESGEVVGHDSKSACHDGQGRLHRAFSVFLFDPGGRLLLQQRAEGKRLWPGYWANSCCSHPRRGEQEADAVQRRVSQELGVHCAPHYIYRFQYHAVFRQLGAEWEDCAVYVGRVDAAQAEAIRPHPEEVKALRWLDVAELDQLVAADAEDLAPWLKLEWAALRATYWSVVSASCGLA